MTDLASAYEGAAVVLAWMRTVGIAIPSSLRALERWSKVRLEDAAIFKIDMERRMERVRGRQTAVCIELLVTELRNEDVI